MEYNKLLEQNVLLQKQILKLEEEIHIIKQKDEVNMFKNKISNLIDDIQNNKKKDEEIYNYIHNIKIDYENKIKNNIILKQCDYILNQIESNSNIINILKMIL